MTERTGNYHRTVRDFRSTSLFDDSKDLVKTSNKQNRLSPNNDDELFISFIIRLNASKQGLWAITASSQSIKSTSRNFLPSSEDTQALQVLP